MALGIHIHQSGYRTWNVGNPDRILQEKTFDPPGKWQDIWHDLVEIARQEEIALLCIPPFEQMTQFGKGMAKCLKAHRNAWENRKPMVIDRIGASHLAMLPKDPTDGPQKTFLLILEENLLFAAILNSLDGKVNRHTYKSAVAIRRIPDVKGFLPSVLHSADPEGTVVTHPTAAAELSEAIRKHGKALENIWQKVQTGQASERVSQVPFTKVNGLPIPFQSLPKAFQAFEKAIEEVVTELNEGRDIPWNNVRVDPGSVPAFLLQSTLARLGASSIEISNEEDPGTTLRKGAESALPGRELFSEGFPGTISLVLQGFQDGGIREVEDQIVATGAILPLGNALWSKHLIRIMEPETDFKVRVSYDSGEEILQQVPVTLHPHDAGFPTEIGIGLSIREQLVLLIRHVAPPELYQFPIR